MKICILIAFLFISFATCADEKVNFETLQLVQVIFRHGERVPEYPYPTDPYNSETTWKEGWGQMTETGKGQEYKLGQYLRSRYGNFISENHVANEIYALSSDTDRTIMSGQLCLAGMFPTENGTEWNPNLTWQPIPLHTIATEQDNMIRCKRKCPRYEELLDQVLYESDLLSKINSDNSQLFKYLSQNSGVEITNIDNIDSFYATMMVEEMLGKEIPAWAKPVVHTENFQYLYNLSFAIKSSTLELKKFRTGPLVKSLMHNINQKVTNSSWNTKFALYSGHDITLVNLLTTLEMLDLQRPPYSSAFILELHQDPKTHDHFVNFLFRNETTREPYKLQLQNCEFDCPLSTFYTYAEPIIPKNWDVECYQNISPRKGPDPTTMYYLAVATTSLFCIGLATYLFNIIWNKVKKRRLPRNDYETF